MRPFQPLRETLLASALWAIVALGSLFVRDGLGTALLFWAPSGVAVAAFRHIPRKQWPLLVAGLLPVQFIVGALVGTSLVIAFAGAVSAVAQATICAALSRKVLGSRTAIPRRVTHVIGLFGSAIASCLVGATLVLPFRPEQSFAEFGAWFLANVLGILIVTPALLHARSVIVRWHNDGRIAVDPALLLALGGCAVLAALALQVNAITLMPLLVAAMIGMAVRFGHPAIAMTLLSYIAVASVLGLGGQSPLLMHDGSIGSAVLELQSWLFTMLATALPLAAILMKREDLQFELIRRNSAMHENLMLLDLAEQLAGIGRWRLDMLTGEQDWSRRMLAIHGLPEDLAPDPGDISHLLPDGSTAMFRKVTSNREEREPFSFDYRIKPPAGAERILRISVLNEFDNEGNRIAIFGAAMEVTEQVHREQALDLARGRAVQLAKEAQELANTDPLTNLPNRRCTFGRLENMVNVAQQHGSALTAIMFDIDHFKLVNDTHGHQTGDEVIVQVAELARRQARQGDLVGRIGGEEFVWLLPRINAAAARALAERLRQSVERGIEGSSLPNITVSIGLAQFEAGDDGDGLLARADAALYKAKESGRNRVRRAA
ncbi:sensor domain-containing diguanylate cyclase [Aurantiacibacter marinus]|uniref:sensor domain-containing diguanylate cyclase n=1 Tax=Aurantiacibacter marinus TaxID=874156 RepID=UPI00069A8353|nr:sensor domain-containing diguanylate cyclase [Aurantiacibacter marinus]